MANLGSSSPECTLTKWGSGGKGDCQFEFPTQIALDGAINVYVTDVGNKQVQAFSVKLQWSWLPQGSFAVDF